MILLITREFKSNTKNTIDESSPLPLAFSGAGHFIGGHWWLQKNDTESEW